MNQVGQLNAGLSPEPARAGCAGFGDSTALAPVNRPSGRGHLLVAVLLGLAILFDYLSGTELTLFFLYFVPIAVAVWQGGRTYGLLVCGLAALAWLGVHVLSGAAYSRSLVYFWNAFARLVAFVLVALLVHRLLQDHQRLVRTVETTTQRLNAEHARRLQMEREIAELSNRGQQRIAQDLHDGLGQLLAGAAFKAKVLAHHLAEDGLAAATDANTLVGLLNRAVGETRNLAQSLDPFSRGQADLRSALTQLARECETLFEMACDVEVPEDLPPLPEELIRQLYRIAQEALSNAFRHGKAAAVQITVRRLPGEIELRVQDDGQGFTVEENRQRPTSGLGLRLMAYRASALGGQLEIASRPDAGCTVTCRCPFPVPATPTATPNSPNHGTQTPPPHRR